MYCTNCGKQMPDGQSFCTACGAALQKNNSAQQAAYQPQSSNSQPAPQPNQQMQQVSPPMTQVNQQTTPVYQGGEVSDKSKTATALFSIFLGGLGIHRFYVGKVGSGIAMLLLSIFGLILSALIIGVPMLIAVGIWDIVDFIMILCGNFTDGQGRKIIN